MTRKKCLKLTYILFQASINSTRWKKVLQGDELRQMQKPKQQHVDISVKEKGWNIIGPQSTCKLPEFAKKMLCFSASVPSNIPAGLFNCLSASIIQPLFLEHCPRLPVEQVYYFNFYKCISPTPASVFLLHLHVYFSFSSVLSLTVNCLS